MKGSLDLKLTYAPSSATEPFLAYSDVDHAGNPDDGCSTSGYIITIGTGTISWASKLQTIIALSTTEAEFVAACTAGQEIVWLRALLDELGYGLSSKSTMLVDNQSAI